MWPHCGKPAPEFSQGMSRSIEPMTKDKARFGKHELALQRCGAQPQSERPQPMSAQTASAQAAGAEGLQIIDTPDRTTPAIAGSFDTPGNANAVRVSGTIAYVAAGGGGVALGGG